MNPRSIGEIAHSRFKIIGCGRCKPSPGMLYFRLDRIMVVDIRSDANFMNLLPTIDTPGTIQLWQWITEPLAYLHNYDRQCGDIFAVNMFGPLNRAVFISNPQSMQEVLTNDTKQFSAPGSTNQILKPFLGDRGIILLDGGEHRQRRQ